MSGKPEKERRQGKRISLAFHVEVSGIGRNGVPYCDHAAASDVSERGCQLHLIREIHPGDLLTVRVVRKKAARAEQEAPFLYQTIWVERSNGGWVAGMVALEPGNPWGISFPQEAYVPE
jgi:hypothetical protein